MQFDGDEFRRWSQRHNSAARSQWKVRWEGNRRRIEKAAAAHSRETQIKSTFVQRVTLVAVAVAASAVIVS